MKKPYQIAIDGPVSAGKGTVSRLVADRLGFLYVDTGAMYRLTALLAQRHNVDFDQEDAIVDLLKYVEIDIRQPSDQEKDGRLTTVLLDGEDVSWAIRTESVSQGASKVAVHPKVRANLVEKQQLIAQKRDVVMEGRDITYRVLPDAQLKIYLTANDVVRAKRRHFQLQTRGESMTFDEVYTELIKRDKQDSERKTDPLQITDDAWVIDTSDLSIEQVVDLIVAKARIIQEQLV